MLLAGIPCFAQTDSVPPPPSFDGPVRSSAAKFSLQERIAFYPFNKATQVKLVSFGVVPGKDGTFKQYSALPKNNDTIAFKEFDQTLTLNLAQIDTLSDILFNECERWTISVYNRAACYFPRNAILFFNSNGEVFEYIEICFACTQVDYSSPAVTEAELCDYMYLELERFFMRQGLKTSDEITD